MASKEHPIYEVELVKDMKDTGQPGKPFFAKVSETKHIRLFGILIKKVTTTGNFPDPDDRK
jgi:hypothetical protein